MRRMTTRMTRVRNAAILLGVGLGGLLNSVVLHQIVQWHGLLSWQLPLGTLEATRRNLEASGWFNLVALGVSFGAAWMLMHAIRDSGRVPSPRAFLGDVLLGWGTFNVVEGLVYHHVLELHHVHDYPAHDPLYDWLYLLGTGIGFILLSFVLRDPRPPELPYGERRSGHDRRSAHA
jgi:uncharacterized membrane protein